MTWLAACPQRRRAPVAGKGVRRKPPGRRPLHLSLPALPSFRLLVDASLLLRAFLAKAADVQGRCLPTERQGGIPPDAGRRRAVPHARETGPGRLSATGRLLRIQEGSIAEALCREWFALPLPRRPLLRDREALHLATRDPFLERGQQGVLLFRKGEAGDDKATRGREA